MPGLFPAIPVAPSPTPRNLRDIIPLLFARLNRVDARDKPGHDGEFVST